ncbi:MAG: hypothetical protein J2P53_00740 [Bradyrhizobiaceae bacterium]|nr:hypothetical protein [Bradyrhizobiaceae bacterium]
MPVHSVAVGAQHAFEKLRGILLPEPYRTVVAEITDGAIAGPPFYDMVKLGSLPKDWGDARPRRDPEAWVWRTMSVSPRNSARCWNPSMIMAPLPSPKARRS